MSNCFIGVLFPSETAPEKVFLTSGPSLLKRADRGPTLEALDQTTAAPVRATNAGSDSADLKARP